MCKGRGFGKCNILHRAVFESDLPALSRLVNCQSESVLYTEKNILDEQNNTPLILAVKLLNIDAIKVLTDLYCSAKINPTP